MGWILGLTILLLWPAFLSGKPLVFPDTVTYYSQGGAVLRIAGDMLGLEAAPAPALPSGTAEIDGAETAAKPEGDGAKSFGGNIRSLPYSILLNGSIRLVGLFAPIAIFALASAAIAMMLMDGFGRNRRLLACLALGIGTNMAFYTSQLMPDILAAWLVAIPMILVLREGRVRPATGLLLLAAGTFATMAHYAHIPLAAIMGAAVFVWAWRRSLRVLAILAQIPLLLTLSFNLVLSVALPDEGGGGGVSIAPARYPILLARAIEDGVAVRYLEAHCDEGRFTICDLYDTFPDNVYDTLWSDETGIVRIATPEQSRAISREELPLLWQVFLFDPLAQTWALVSNMVEQVVRFGLGDMYEAQFDTEERDKLISLLEKPRPQWFHVAAGIQYVVVAVATLALMIGWPGMTRPMRGMVLMGGLGLLANAAICGGLSVPTDRYQGRVIWLVVLAAFVTFPGQWRAFAARRGADPDAVLRAS